MPAIQKFFLFAISPFLLIGCKHGSNTKKNASKNDSLVLKILFEPSFEERSETILIKSDSLKTLQILIKNNIRVDEMEDTFYFKKIFLTDQQYAFLDSSIIKNSRIKISYKENIGLDGMSICYYLIDKQDTNRIVFWSPNEKRNSMEYKITKSTIDNLRVVFKDTIIKDYFDDVETYINVSKIPILSYPNRKINELRKKKYNWK